MGPATARVSKRQPPKQPLAHTRGSGTSVSIMQTSLRRLRCLAFIFVSLTVLWLRAGSQPRLREAAGFQLSSQSCSACHQAIFDGFVRTAHFQTSSRADERSWRDGLLYELPVSWLVEPAAWMNSPGY